MIEVHLEGRMLDSMNPALYSGYPWEVSVTLQEISGRARK